MEVRPARPEDCEALARGMKVVVDEGRWLATEPPITVEELRERFRTAVEAGDHRLFLLEDGAELAGALGLHPGGVQGVLQLGMWLLPEHRGRGGGRQLLEAALAGRPKQAHKIELEVFPDNEAAIHLYRSMGFEVEGVRRSHYRRRDGSLRSAVIMARLFD